MCVSTFFFEFEVTSAKHSWTMARNFVVLPARQLNREIFLSSRIPMPSASASRIIAVRRMRLKTTGELVVATIRGRGSRVAPRLKMKHRAIIAGRYIYIDDDYLLTASGHRALRFTVFSSSFSTNFTRNLKVFLSPRRSFHFSSTYRRSEFLPPKWIDGVLCEKYLSHISPFLFVTFVIS